MRALENLQPERVFYYFEEISKIPHGSQNTKQISDYLVAFAKEHKLEYYQDQSNNVVIIKEATSGYENSEAVIIQGHMDMVCEKESGSQINFEKDPLEIYVDGDFVKAKDTTLGGDDGIAVAYALALLESTEYSHPRLEVVITVDEEIGMCGAYDIDLSMLKGKKMLNIDSDDEGIFLTSCAGGMGVNATLPIKRISQKGEVFELKLSGLCGGHSGGEIHKEHGNADILMGRVLAKVAEQIPFGIIQLAGGLKDNAIPRECISSIMIPTDFKEQFKNIIEELNVTLKKEFFKTDENISIAYQELGEKEENILDFSSVNKVLLYLRLVPNGVMHMSQAMPSLVETSLNLGIMELKEDALVTVTSIRSSVSSRKEDLKNKVVTLIEMLGGQVEIEGDYSAWEYKPDSTLREEIKVVYKNMFGEEPRFEAIHAGLECGILSEKIKDLDCVSFGPQNYDIHTPQERLSISSTKRVWEFLVEYLKQAK